MSSCKKISLSCESGGKRIFAEALVPENASKTVILSHGYNSSHSDMTDTVGALAENGFCAAYYDFCGGSARSKSEGSPLEMSVFTEQADLRAVIGAVREAGLPDSIYLYGESQGGFVSALEMSDPNNRIDGAFLIYPAFCIPDDWRTRSVRDDETFYLMGMELSAKFQRELPEYDVYERISGFEKPVIIFHGDADGLVALSYSEKVKESLKNSELIVFPGEGHGFSAAAREKMNKRIIEFLKENSLQPENEL